MKVELPKAAIAAAAPETREFRSLQMVLDHLQVREDGHEVVKFVMSTQIQLDALSALAGYYQMGGALATPAALAIVASMSGEDAPVLVLTTPENTQVLFDLDDWAAIQDYFPSQFAVCDFLAQAVAEQYKNALNERGGLPALMMFGLNGIKAKAPEPDVPQPTPKGK